MLNTENFIKYFTDNLLSLLDFWFKIFFYVPFWLFQKILFILINFDSTNITCFFTRYQVEFLFISPIIGIFIVLVFIKKESILTLKKFALVYSWFILIYSIFVSFNLIKYNNLEGLSLTFKYYNIYFSIYKGLDYVILIYDTTLLFLIIVALITFVCMLLSWSRNAYNYKLIISAFFLLEFFAFQFFSVYNLLMLYIYFEATIIPTLILIGVWGSRLRKNIAFYYIYFVTGLGSILMLISIIIIYNEFGTLNTIDISTNIARMSWYSTALHKHFTWLLLTMCFIIKMPSFLFYNWLLEAHVEAPVEGSVILSGYILKYGIWGLLAHVFIIYPTISDLYFPMLILFVFSSVIYSTFAAIRSHDFKKCIAYTSIAHMSLALLGLISKSVVGLAGCIILSFSHSITSPGLFIIAGLLYEKFSVRDIRYLGSLTMYLLPLYFFFLTLTNIGFPGTINFIGELKIFLSIYEIGMFSSYFIILSSIFFGAIFGVWVLTRVSFTHLHNNEWSDISLKEHSILLMFCFILLFFGLFPIYLNFFLNDIINLHIFLRNLI